jgi:hypothetical protein
MELYTTIASRHVLVFLLKLPTNMHFIHLFLPFHRQSHDSVSNFMVCQDMSFGLETLVIIPYFQQDKYYYRMYLHRKYYRHTFML